MKDMKQMLSGDIASLVHKEAMLFWRLWFNKQHTPTSYMSFKAGYASGVSSIICYLAEVGCQAGLNAVESMLKNLEEKGA